MWTLTGLSGEYVTFDQNGQKCNCKLVVADLENWQFWKISNDFQRFRRIVKARIFWYFEILKFRMMTSYFRETMNWPFLEVNQNRNTTTTIVAKETTTGNRKTRQSNIRDRSEL